jgi:hypothetical protein
MKNRIKLFESWLVEAKTEASPEEIKDLLNLLVPIIKKSVDDTMRFEMEYAKKLADSKNDNQRSKLFVELNQKLQDAEFFLNSKGKVSQSQMQKILSWSETMKGLLINKEFSAKQEEFKNLGADVSRWKEMYDPAKISNDILIKNRDFEKEMGIKPPLITG